VKRSGVRAAVLLVPAAALFIISFVVPLVIAFRLSLFSTDFVISKFVGMRNYIRLFTEEDFLRSFVTAGTYVAMVVPTAVGVSYWLSLRLSQLGKKECSFFRGIYFLPSLTAGIIISFTWRWVFGRLGLLAAASALLGLPVVAWFGEGWPARIVIAFAVTFSTIGGTCIWLSAVLLSIPKELYDQAKIDGASRWQISRYIIGPMMKPTLMLVAILTGIGALQYWEIIYSLTSGGPYKMTATPAYDIYTTAFIYGQHGLAAAKSVFLMVVIALLIGGMKLLEKRAK
jgi:multiple sugar transport system permease protein